ncbi:nucleoside deaminase [Streptomyces sp. NBC_00178]|uniref:nucleoside deaminase n=1 Tax=Streptomyces sp. NBC_00178 TaxID=2975672 RepID=UPI002E284D22|nr:nucleoside deaminase [Streptomyces sp. NBC_00178]
MTTAPLSAAELLHVERAVDLAGEALAAGDEPFGSVLVDSGGQVLREARNLVRSTGDHTRHPEFELARWAAGELAPGERARCVVFTSGEHCPMCAAAHGWAGLGRIVYAHSSAELTRWLGELGVPPSPVRPLAIGEVVPGLDVHGPVAAFTDRLRSMHRELHARGGGRP